MSIDLSMGDTHLYCNGSDLKVYSSRFLRNWSYQSASRGPFAPAECAYATITLRAQAPTQARKNSSFGSTGSSTLEMDARSRSQSPLWRREERSPIASEQAGFPRREEVTIHARNDREAAKAFLAWACPGWGLSL